MGTEFYMYNDGANPKQAKAIANIREQHGAVLYETNVLGSKGPRKMKVLVPLVTADGQQLKWQNTEKELSIAEKFKANQTDNIMFLYNKPPKWNESV